MSIELGMGELEVGDRMVKLETYNLLSVELFIVETKSTNRSVAQLMN